MFLSAQTIRRLEIVHPCLERDTFRGRSFGLSCCGYDVRADLRAAINSGRYRPVSTPDADGILLDPGQSVLVDVQGHFVMPQNVVGFVKDKSTWARQGVFTNQGVLEPNWKGALCIRLVNHGTEELSIVEGDAIAQIVFAYLDETPERTYAGKYQGTRHGDTGARFE